MKLANQVRRAFVVFLLNIIHHLLIVRFVRWDRDFLWDNMELQK